MGRPPKLLSNEKCSTITTDLEFAKQMINTRNLSVADLKAVLRHINMVHDDIVDAINARTRQK